MCETAQRSLQPADYDRNIAVCLPDLAAVDDGGTVGTRAGSSACRIRVVTAFALGGGVMSHHGIDIAAADEKAETRATETGKILHAFRLRQNTHPIALRFQHAGNDRDTEAGMIDIGVSRYRYDVRLLPAARTHFFLCNR